MAVDIAILRILEITVIYVIKQISLFKIRLPK